MFVKQIKMFVKQSTFSSKITLFVKKSKCSSKTYISSKTCFFVIGITSIFKNIEMFIKQIKLWIPTCDARMILGSIFNRKLQKTNVDCPKINANLKRKTNI